ncbi:MAG: aminoacyl-tRNA hydrolase [Actinomycetota bacterium]|jgi:PTH1 family peptidyl-tRNA hydrolase|nr:aminoacyl-tRNA hydrolase [Actinomycetota bacterium]
MTRMIVGLGNPGHDYANTRHNAGFMAVDLIAENLRASYWKDEYGARTSLVRLGDEEILLVEPQTFMNLSGSSVRNLAEAYDASISEIIVVHDDLDLTLGLVKVKRGGGHGGHNGLRSLHEKLDDDGYLRVRVGIGRPPGRMDAADYVLQRMRPSVAEELEAVMPTAAQAAIHVLEHGVDSAMREFNAS